MSPAVPELPEPPPGITEVSPELLPEVPPELPPELPPGITEESPELLPGMLPELLPELPPEGGGSAGLLSFSEGGVDGIASGAVCDGGGVLVPLCSVPPPPPPRSQPARLIVARPSKRRIFDACDFGFIPIPFN